MANKKLPLDESIIRLQQLSGIITESKIDPQISNEVVNKKTVSTSATNKQPELTFESFHKQRLMMLQEAELMEKMGPAGRLLGSIAMAGGMMLSQFAGACNADVHDMISTVDAHPEISQQMTGDFEHDKNVVCKYLDSQPKDNSERNVIDGETMKSLGTSGQENVRQSLLQKDKDIKTMMQQNNIEHNKAQMLYQLGHRPK